MVDFSALENNTGAIYTCYSIEEAMHCCRELFSRFNISNWTIEDCEEIIRDTFDVYEYIALIPAWEDGEVYICYDTDVEWLMSTKPYCTYPMHDFSACIFRYEDFGEIVSDNADDISILFGGDQTNV